MTKMMPQKIHVQRTKDTEQGKHAPSSISTYSSNLNAELKRENTVLDIEAATGIGKVNSTSDDKLSENPARYKIFYYLCHALLILSHAWVLYNILVIKVMHNYHVYENNNAKFTHYLLVVLIFCITGLLQCGVRIEGDKHMIHYLLLILVLYANEAFFSWTLCSQRGFGCNPIVLCQQFYDAVRS